MTQIERLRFCLVENWCLCKYSQLFNPEGEAYTLWLQGLKNCIDNLRSLNIKNSMDKRKTLVDIFINDYDYNNAKMIERIIRDRCTAEHINDTQKAQLCTVFANHIEELIDVMADDSISTESYLENSFA